MKKSWGLIPKILSGEKTIESRWYQTKRAPWGRIRRGDTIYFKNAGEPVVAKATITGVLQFEIGSADEASKIVRTHGKRICLINDDPHTWEKTPNYCILAFLERPEEVPKPFHIRKSGFGAAAAWLTVEDIAAIKVV
ncbi:MAG: hypothetical protein HYS43_01295 [Candidatus Liptonbacteria bacterium]|nr:hypothetical protein [Candidatus Liptonbacteria bacterium]